MTSLLCACLPFLTPYIPWTRPRPKPTSPSTSPSPSTSNHPTTAPPSSGLESSTTPMPLPDSTINPAYISEQEVHEMLGISNWTRDPHTYTNTNRPPSSIYGPESSSLPPTPTTPYSFQFQLHGYLVSTVEATTMTHEHMLAERPLSAYTYTSASTLRSASASAAERNGPGVDCVDGDNGTEPSPSTSTSTSTESSNGMIHKEVIVEQRIEYVPSHT
ncbi:uncharacterized protein DSM5745_06585 [Aspergillus mulundensis]|uniref:Uncharacterized protein n=1 Tax=Aspergillus mulundensis TaxID=1810919 RepID=A0A3D8RR94_9EURO|nr:hypothetical protein DSM5745_06585 [Aspergillus mulundensis]RDW76593.1 hypothetical protein DSM5745_06585 [Aspergillus mulundensis]